MGCAASTDAVGIPRGGAGLDHSTTLYDAPSSTVASNHPGTSDGEQKVDAEDATTDVESSSLGLQRNNSNSQKEELLEAALQQHEVLSKGPKLEQPGGVEMPPDLRMIQQPSNNNATTNEIGVPAVLVVSAGEVQHEDKKTIDDNRTTTAATSTSTNSLSSNSNHRQHPFFAADAAVAMPASAVAGLEEYIFSGSADSGNKQHEKDTIGGSCTRSTTSGSTYTTASSSSTSASNAYQMTEIRLGGSDEYMLHCSLRTVQEETSESSMMDFSASRSSMDLSSSGHGALSNEQLCLSPSTSSHERRKQQLNQQGLKASALSSLASSSDSLSSGSIPELPPRPTTPSSRKTSQQQPPSTPTHRQQQQQRTFCSPPNSRRPRQTAKSRASPRQSPSYATVTSSASDSMTRRSQRVKALSSESVGSAQTTDPVFMTPASSLGGNRSRANTTETALLEAERRGAEVAAGASASRNNLRQKLIQTSKHPSLRDLGGAKDRQPHAPARQTALVQSKAIHSSLRDVTLTGDKRPAVPVRRRNSREGEIGATRAAARRTMAGRKAESMRNLSSSSASTLSSGPFLALAPRPAPPARSLGVKCASARNIHENPAENVAALENQLVTMGGSAGKAMSSPRRKMVLKKAMSTREFASGSDFAEAKLADDSKPILPERCLQNTRHHKSMRELQNATTPKTPRSKVTMAGAHVEIKNPAPLGEWMTQQRLRKGDMNQTLGSPAASCVRSVQTFPLDQQHALDSDTMQSPASLPATMATPQPRTKKLVCSKHLSLRDLSTPATPSSDTLPRQPTRSLRSSGRQLSCGQLGQEHQQQQKMMLDRSTGSDTQPQMPERSSRTRSAVDGQGGGADDYPRQPVRNWNTEPVSSAARSGRATRTTGDCTASHRRQRKSGTDLSSKSEHSPLQTRRKTGSRDAGDLVKPRQTKSNENLEIASASRCGGRRPAPADKSPCAQQSLRSMPAGRSSLAMHGKQLSMRELSNDRRPVVPPRRRPSNEPSNNGRARPASDTTRGGPAYMGTAQNNSARSRRSNSDSLHSASDHRPRIPARNLSQSGKQKSMRELWSSPRNHLGSGLSDYGKQQSMRSMRSSDNVPHRPMRRSSQVEQGRSVSGSHSSRRTGPPTTMASSVAVGDSTPYSRQPQRRPSSCEKEARLLIPKDSTQLDMPKPTALQLGDGHSPRGRVGRQESMEAELFAEQLLPPVVDHGNRERSYSEQGNIGEPRQCDKRGQVKAKHSSSLSGKKTPKTPLTKQRMKSDSHVLSTGRKKVEVISPTKSKQGSPGMNRSSGKSFHPGFSHSTMDTDIYSEIGEPVLDDQFYLLLNQNPWGEKVLFDDSAIRAVIQEDPRVCQSRFTFDNITDASLFPLSMLSALGAELATIELCYAAHPDAILYSTHRIGTALHYACTYKSPIANIRFLLEKRPALALQKNLLRRLPLHLACMSQPTVAYVSVLMKYDKKMEAVKSEDRDGKLPLHHACEKDADLSVIELLCRAYPEACTVQSSRGYTPLHLAVLRCAPEPVLRCLIQCNDRALQMADRKGQLPLHVSATVLTKYECVELLLKSYRFASEARNLVGARPVDLAKQNRANDYKLHKLLEG